MPMLHILFYLIAEAMEFFPTKPAAKLTYSD